MIPSYGFATPETISRLIDETVAMSFAFDGLDALVRAAMLPAHSQLEALLEIQEDLDAINSDGCTEEVLKRLMYVKKLASVAIEMRAADEAKESGQLQ